MLGLLSLTACSFALSAFSKEVTLDSHGPTEAQLRAAEDILQVRAKEIWLGDGRRITDGLIVVKGGKITSVGKGEPDASQLLVEHEGVVTAGMVVCQSLTGAWGETYDSTRSVLPTARVAHGIDPHDTDFGKALTAGITSLVITPTRNVVGGLTAVVDARGKVRARASHLAISLASTALSSGNPQSDGIENTIGFARGTRYPTSYAGALHELERLFAKPEGVFARAASGQLPVVIEAWDRNEVSRALTFAKAHGLTGAVRGAPLAGELAAQFKDSGLAAILGPYRPGHSRASLESFARLSEAGVAVGFALDQPAFEPAGLRMSAALTLGAGAKRDDVWNALTSGGARIAGIDKQVGTLESGKQADLVLWSGDPLELTSRVEAVYVAGELAHTGGDQ